MSIQIDKMQDHGREMAVVYRCSRCNAISMLPFAEAVRFEIKESPHANDVAYLHNTVFPDGWQDHYGGKIFCKDCAADYERFMRPPARVKEG